jgi:predicted DNA-binding protein (MmcQ/YjbR family)
VDESDEVARDGEVLERIRRICLELPEAEEGTLQGRALFHVRRRRFAIVNGITSPARPRWRDAGRSLHLLVEPSERDALRQDPRFAPSPHHGHRGWFATRLDDPLTDWDELAELLAAAHGQVAPKDR